MYTWLESKGATPGVKIKAGGGQIMKNTPPISAHDEEVLAAGQMLKLESSQLPKLKRQQPKIAGSATESKEEANEPAARSTKAQKK